jgi:hypothetical protein
VLSVSAESKGLICTKMVQNLGVLGTAHSKGLSCDDEGFGKSCARLLILQVFIAPIARIGRNSEACSGKQALGSKNASDRSEAQFLTKVSKAHF